MGQEQPPHDFDSRSDLDSTQPSPTQPPRQLDWRPPDYRSDEEEPSREAPAVRHMAHPRPRRRRPPTEGAPAWVVGLGVGALLAVIVLLGVAFVLSRPSAEPEPTATVILVTPTETLVPRPTFTTPPEMTATSESGLEATEAPTAPPPDVIGIGGYVRVVALNGLSFRQTASTDGALIQILDNGTVLEVIDGPQEAGGYTWWKLRNPADDREGWSAAGAEGDVFLEPAPAP